MFTTKEILDLCEARGLEVKEQSAFYKIARDLKAIYVAKTKRGVTRIDVSGFTIEHEAVRPPTKKNGRVTGQINVTHEDAQEALLLGLDALTDGTTGNKAIA